ncbi:hypothetical protein CRUP_027903 [Coryphaenoides rupestris]|nr:hypothetical protein CRUP_027903 [Coryphaenoides rupestris]
MAAIDLRRGLEHGGRGWGQEARRPGRRLRLGDAGVGGPAAGHAEEIEELYNEVQARRGGNDIPTDKQKTNGGALHFDGLGRHGNGFQGNPVVAVTAPKHHGGGGVSGFGGGGGVSGFGCGYGSGGYGYPAGGQNAGYGYNSGDYLGQGKDGKRRNNGARHVHFNDTIDVSRDLPKHQGEAKSRNCHQCSSGSVEETENRKNRMSQSKSGAPKESSGAKPPLRQRDPSPAAVGARSASSQQQHAGMHGDSPALDRKCSSSPSVLRKFGAMLQENEGKTLTDAGVVTHPDPPSPWTRPKAQGPIATAPPAGRESEPGQRRAQVVAGSPRPRPRADSGSERDGRRGCAPAPRYGEQPRGDYKALSGAQRTQHHQRAQGEGTCDGLIELLDMLDIQHEYSPAPRGGRAPYRQDPRQINPAESSTATHTNSFSRPARPANQRPPSRWAGRTPTARITAPSGRDVPPPSPLARPPAP